MNLLKITDFFETYLLHNFYSINDIGMSLGNLDSCHHTHNRIKVKKNKKSLANFNVLQALLECTHLKFLIFSKLIIIITFIL